MYVRVFTFPPTRTHVVGDFLPLVFPLFIPSSREVYSVGLSPDESPHGPSPVPRHYLPTDGSLQHVSTADTGPTVSGCVGACLSLFASLRPVSG